MCVLMVSYYQGCVCISCLRPGLPVRLFVAVSLRTLVIDSRCEGTANKTQKPPTQGVRVGGTD